MATPALDSSASYAFDNSSTSQSFNNVAGTFMIAAITHDFSMSVTGITYNGDSLSSAVINNGTGETPDHVSLYYLANPATGSNTFSLTMDDDDDSGLFVTTWTGVKAVSPVDATNTGTDTTSPVSISVTTGVAGALVIAVFGDDDASASARTPAADTTEIFDVIHGSGAGDYGAYLGYRIGGAAGAHALGYTNGSVSSGAQAIASFIAAADIEQEGFAFGDDDGTESGHTLDTQDTNISEAVGTKTLRMLLNSDDDPGNTAFKLKYQKNGSGGYIDVPVGATTMMQPTPVVADVTESGNNTATSSWAVSVPDADEGDLLIICIAWDDATTTATVTQPSGQDGETISDIGEGVISTPSGSHANRLQVFYVVTTAAWTAGTITFTPSASEQWTAAVLRVPAGEFDSSTPIGATANDVSANGSSSQVDSPAFTAGASDGDGLLCVFAGVDADPISGTPTGWTDLSDVDRGATSEVLSVRDTYVTDSESIASVNWTISSDSWGTIGFIIRAAGSTNNEVYVSASANVAAGGEATTARLTAPSGKTSGSDFDTGRRWDDENGDDSIDITDGDYTELEWVLTTQSPATGGDYFEFRVYEGDVAMATYTVTPKWTIPGGASGIRAVRQLVGHGQGTRD